MKLRHIAAASALFGLAACSSDFAGTAEASREELLTATAVVENVDLSTRQVTVANPDTGERLIVNAGPEVVNLPQLEPGDVVEMGYYESVFVAMADPADTGEELSTVAVLAPPEGEKPGAVAVETTSMVVEVVSYDPNAGLATVILPDGTRSSVTVAPEMRRFASNRRRGDRLAVTMTEAFAVFITEQTG